MLHHPVVPPPVPPSGGRVALIAPSWLPDRDFPWKRIQTLFEQNGWEVVLDYLPRNDSVEERARSILKALDDPSISVLWAVRGGGNALELLDLLPWNRFQQNPRWLVGFSDVSALLMKAWLEARLVSVHGHVASTLPPWNPPRREIFLAPPPPMEWEHNCVVEGRARGILIGGNFSLLFALREDERNRMRGCILFLEDTGESPLSLLRMIQALDRQGFWQGLSGLVLGTFTEIRRSRYPRLSSIEELFVAIGRRYGFPVAGGFPAGHFPDSTFFWMGTPVYFRVQGHRAFLSWG